MENTKKLPEIKEKDWRFIIALGERRLTISEIQEKINPNGNLSEAQKIYTKLKERGLVEDFKEGTKRFIQLNSNGTYFHNFYKKHKK